MLSISQNGGSWFGMDNRVRNSEEAFKMGGNMGGTVQQSIAQKFEKVTKIALFIKFHECSCHRIKRKLLSKYCYMGLRMHPSF